MWRCSILVASVLWAALSFSQAMDQFSEAVVFVYRAEQHSVVKDGKQLMETQIKYDTGFLVTPDNNTMLLVTADHVSADVKSDFRAIVRGDGDSAIEMSSEELTGTKNVVWISHEKEDVAVTILHPSNNVRSKLAGRSMLTNLISSDVNAPSRDRPLTTLGFPLTLGANGHFSPVSRESKPSSGLITLPRFDTHTPATFSCLLIHQSQVSAEHLCFLRLLLMPCPTERWSSPKQAGRRARLYAASVLCMEHSATTQAGNWPL